MRARIPVAFARGSALVASSLLTLGCSTSRDNARCLLVAPPPVAASGTAAAAAGPPQFSAMAANPYADPVRLTTTPVRPLTCDASPTLDGRFFPTAPVDDLSAIMLGTAPDSDRKPQGFCPVLSKPPVLETASIQVPPCGPTACPNKQIVIPRGDVAVHVLFYDNPALHRAAGQDPSGACYYRVYAMSVSLEGPGPQK